MNTYIISLAVGVMVGIAYGLLNVRSPAPPIVALVGLLGILAGEQIVPAAKFLLSNGARKNMDVSRSWLKHQVQPHMFGKLPQGTKLPLIKTQRGSDKQTS